PPSSQTSYTPPPPRAPMAPMVGESVPNYLVQSILVTLCCCLPLGVVAIVFAAQVNSKLSAGDIQGAREASRMAKMFCWVAFGLGLAIMLIWTVTGGAAFLQGVRDGMANR
ncbi:MAG TPA: CD225/dispanin family protein, partial [Gemmatimonadaceae bacterium]|nr:CD225/dispanin family protein [Gemmatimonadaceae bacterium]